MTNPQRQAATARQPRGGLGAVASESFDVSAAVGGWRGVVESTAPTVVFILVLALRPAALVPALLASLALSAVAMAARLAQRQSLTQVLGGAFLAAVSALWAWRSGQAANFYATGLLINAGWLSVCLVSLLAGWPLVGVLVGLWQRAAQADTDQDSAQESEPSSGSASGSGASSWASWRKDPALRADRKRYYLGTLVLSAMFALRLVVEVPMYLAGESALAALGVARLVLGVPLFVLTLWFVWLLVRPTPRPEQAH